MIFVFPTRRKFLFFAQASFTSLLCIVLGCKAPEISKDAAVVVVESAPRNLDPLFASDAISQKLNNLIHSALIQIGHDMKPKSELAQTWKIKNHQIFHFRLHPSLKFQDGSPLTAKDVKESFERFLDPKNGSSHALAFSQIQKIWYQGKLDFFFETKIPQPFLINDLSLIKIYKKKEQGQDGNAIWFNENNIVISSGRFKLAKISLDEAVLERFIDYPEKPTKFSLKKIIFKFVRDDTTRYQLLMRGDVNVLISGLSISKTNYLKEHLPQHLKIVDSPGINLSYLSFNFKNPILKNLKVRQAIAHAIHREKILKYRYSGYAYLATGILAPVHEGYEPHVKRYEYDPDLAKKLLDEAGFPQKGQWRFALKIKSTSEKHALDMVRLIAHELEQVGIQIQLQIVELGTFFSDIKAGYFDLFCSRWVGVNNPSIYYRVFHSSQILQGVNRGVYKNPILDSLLEKAVKEVNDMKRNSLFSQIQKTAAEDLPYINLWHWNNTFIGNQDMQNILMYPNGNYLTLAYIERY